MRTLTTKMPLSSKLISIAILALILSSCTTSKITRYFLPSINDHEQVFACDTLKGTPSSLAIYPKATQQQIPYFHEWLPATALKDGYDIQSILHNSGTNSLIVVHRDSIIFEAYKDNRTAQTPQMVFSITKAVISILCHIAEEEGHWSLQQPVSDFIPAFKQKNRAPITLQHLLDMTSGLKWDDEVNFRKMAFLYYSEDINTHAVKKSKLVSVPGDNFAYGSLSTQLLTDCLEKAISKKASIYLQDKIWTPVGMQDEAFFTLDNKEEGQSRGFAGLAISPRDLLRLGKLLKNDGTWENQQIIPQKLIQSVKTRVLHQQQWWGYSNCFWRNAANYDNLENLDYFAAVGHLGQFIYVDPTRDILIIRTAFKQPFKWSLTIGRLASLIATGHNQWTNTKKGMLNQFNGNYQSEDGSSFSLQEVHLHKKNKTQFTRSWQLNRADKNLESIPKNINTLYDFDENSIGFIRLGSMIRLQAHYQQGKLLGIYVDNREAVQPKYFKKVSTNIVLNNSSTPSISKRRKISLPKYLK